MWRRGLQCGKLGRSVARSAGLTSFQIRSLKVDSINPCVSIAILRMSKQFHRLHLFPTSLRMNPLFHTPFLASIPN